MITGELKNRIDGLWDVFAGKEPPLENVKETLAGLESFQTTFKVDLKKPIKELKQYIAEKEVK